VETEDRFEWIGGSSIGGGTFWGLGALLTKTKVFQQLQKGLLVCRNLCFPGSLRKGYS
jgi:pantothenate kinase